MNAVTKLARKMADLSAATFGPPERLAILGSWGLGDAIYARPLIAAAARRRDVYLETPWPELYADLPIRFTRGNKALRTQQRNMLRQPAGLWSPSPPIGTETVALGYGPLELPQSDVFSVMAGKLPMRGRPVWDLPALGESPIDTDGAPLAVIRPVTLRTEWQNNARACRPEYIDHIAGDLKDAGYAVVVVADLSHEEWLVGHRMPPHHAALTRGEMTPRQLLATVRDAAVVVGGVGWIVPACIATKTPCFVVLGGNGGMNAPERLINREMDASRIGFAIPGDFCQCTDMDHVCDKTIPDLTQQWQRWRKRLLPGPDSSAAA